MRSLRRTGAGFALLLAAALAPCAGCASHFALRGSEATSALQWPFAPKPAKLTYVRSISGLTEAAGAGTRLKALVYGREKADRYAFLQPVAVAATPDGRIAVADMGRKCVHLFVPAEKRYIALTGGKDDRIGSPVGVVFGARSRLYVADSTGKVLVFAPDGTFETVLRNAGTRPIARPAGLAYNAANGLLYVVDTVGATVHAFDAQGTLAFSFGSPGDGEGQFNRPTAIACAPDGTLFVTDALNFRIAIFDASGRPLGSFGHHGDGSGDLALPKGVAADADGVVYVADGLLDHVQLFDPKGTFLVTLGQRGVGDGEFWLPSGIFIDGQTLYVCDTYNHRVQVFRITEDYAPFAS